MSAIEETVAKTTEPQKKSPPKNPKPLTEADLVLHFTGYKELSKSYTIAIMQQFCGENHITIDPNGRRKAPILDAIKAHFKATGIYPVATPMVIATTTTPEKEANTYEPTDSDMETDGVENEHTEEFLPLGDLTEAVEEAAEEDADEEDSDEDDAETRERFDQRRAELFNMTKTELKKILKELHKKLHRKDDISHLSHDAIVADILTIEFD